MYAAPPDTATALAATKQVILDDFRARYQGLRAQWLAMPELAARPQASAQALQRLDLWAAQANNAAFGALSAYELWVPAFLALFAQQAGQQAPWRAFHAAVEQLSRLPDAERQAALCALMPPGEQPPVCRP